MDELMISIATKYPQALAVLSAIGILRAINKPLFALARSLVSATETKSDDQVLDQVEQSKLYKGFCFLLDYLMSIKIQPPAPPAQPKDVEPEIFK